MADTEHTPGPWHRDADGFISSAKETIADPHCSSLDIDEREANAALIAAAPIMLAALIEVNALHHIAATSPCAALEHDLPLDRVKAAWTAVADAIAAATKVNADV